MQSAADLEIALHRREGSIYSVEIRLLPPGADEEVRPDSGTMELDLEALRGEADDAAYGRLLGGALLADGRVRTALSSARAVADAANVSLRVRLLVGPTAPELHALRWELSCDPNGRQTLFTGERLLFSRYISSSDWRPLQPRAALRAFAFIANPSDVARFNLAPVRIADELAGITTAFGAAVHSLPAGGRATLGALLDALRLGYDVLYVVAHGKLIRGEPKVYLEKDDGTADVVTGSDLVERLSELRVRPRVVVLGSCQSAGTADQPTANGPMAALGPRLAQSGVPAVVAMQGTVSMDTETLFMAAFFKQLRDHGCVDVSMSVARTAALVAGRPDWWMPVLFMRLKSGRVWYEPGFVSSAGTDFEKWKAICNQVLKGDFVPILGPELGEDIFGSSRELAGLMADEYKFPMAAHERNDLAKVTQFISTDQDRVFVQDEVQRFQREILLKIQQAQGPADSPAVEATSLLALCRAAAERCQAQDGHTYRLLTEMPASVFVNASYESTLFRALQQSGRKPEAIFTVWKGTEVPKRPEPKSERPQPDAPWVYHVFGGYGMPGTMVLTEDDFFDYLIDTSRQDLLPPTLVGRLMQSSLLFMGFRLDDWRFRVLFRMIVTRPGTGTLEGLSHVGVQVNPDEHSLADVERARKYMEKYFRGSNNVPKISIYWGSANDFLKELKQQLTLFKPSRPAAKAADSDDWQ